MRVCYRCKTQKSETAFGKNKKQKDGINLICLECDRKAHAERRLAQIRKMLINKYNGCSMCGSSEGLSIISLVDRKRHHKNEYVLLCNKCKIQKDHAMNAFLRDCVRCGYRWVARKMETVVCPKCGSPYWFKPRFKV